MEAGYYFYRIYTVGWIFSGYSPYLLNMGEDITLEKSPRELSGTIKISKDHIVAIGLVQA